MCEKFVFGALTNALGSVSSSSITPTSIRSVSNVLSAAKYISDGVSQIQTVSEGIAPLKNFTDVLAPVKSVTDVLAQVKNVTDQLNQQNNEETASPCRRAPVESNANRTCGQRRVETTPRGGACGRAPVETNVNTGSCRRAPVETNVNAGSCRRPPVETNANAGPSPRETVEKKVPEGNAESGINWGKMLALLGGGAMVGYLAYRVHDMYRNSQQPNECTRSTAVTSSRDLGRSRKLECVFCCQTDELETKVKLTCGHSIHKKCLKYMYVYFQMENLGRPRCALEDCNTAVSSNLLEEIEVWVAMDME